MSVLSFNLQEKQTVRSLGLVFACRMLGLFMIMPVLGAYGVEYADYSPTLLGLAIGCYGLTQACLQIPFGWCSDRWGRKRMIVIGLALFAFGSAIAALSDSLFGVLCGRLIQGSGAVASVILALAADLSRVEVRSKLMAFMGISIGISFVLSFILGAVLTPWLGIHGVFWLSMLLALVAIGVVVYVTPNPGRESSNSAPVATFSAQLKQVLSNPQLLRLDFSIFALHCLLTSIFVVVPLALTHAGIVKSSLWMVYLPVMLVSFVLMGGLMGMAARRKANRALFIASIVGLAIACVLLALFNQTLWGLLPGLLLFFVCFNLLEGKLPSFTSQVVAQSVRGTAMGVYSTLQFAGVFVGGAVSGVLFQHLGLASVFVFAAILAFIWLGIALSLQIPQNSTT